MLCSPDLPLMYTQTSRAARERNRKRALARYGLTGDDLEPPVDGVFRALQQDQAVAAGAGAAALGEGTSSVEQAHDGRWVASLNLSGELYQAFFVQQEDALEALNAAGYAVT